MLFNAARQTVLVLLLTIGSHNPLFAAERTAAQQRFVVRVRSEITVKSPVVSADSQQLGWAVTSTNPVGLVVQLEAVETNHLLQQTTATEKLRLQIDPKSGKAWTIDSSTDRAIQASSQGVGSASFVLSTESDVRQMVITTTFISKD